MIRLRNILIQTEYAGRGLGVYIRKILLEVTRITTELLIESCSKEKDPFTVSMEDPISWHTCIRSVTIINYRFAFEC